LHHIISKFIASQVRANAKLIKVERKKMKRNKHMQKHTNTTYAHYDIKSESSLAPNIIQKSNRHVRRT